MNKLFRLALAIVFLSIVGIFVIASISVTGQKSPRGECEQKCTQDYQACRKAPNANQAQCKQAMDACKTGCKDVPPQPSPSVEPSVEPTATPTPTPSPKEL